jgi:hypothetical protein
MVYEGYNEGFINKLITGEARVVSDKNWGLLQPRIGISSYQPKKNWDRPKDLKLPMVYNVLLTFDDLGYPSFRKPPFLWGNHSKVWNSQMSDYLCSVSNINKNR